MLGPHERGALGVAVDEGVHLDLEQHPLGGLELDHPNGVVERSTHDPTSEGLGDCPREVVPEDSQGSR